MVFSIGFFMIVNSSASPLPGGHTNPKTADPHSGGSCHDPSGYNVTLNITSVQLDSGGNITVQLTATGNNVTFRYVDGSRDNNEFLINTSHIISDGDPEDEDTNPDSLKVTILLTTPDTDGDYTVIFVVKDGSGSAPPNLNYQELTVRIGAGTLWYLAIWQFIQYNILNHYNIYIGGAAIFCLALGTILYEINNQKYTKAHGQLAATGFILTTINVILILITPETTSAFDTFANPATMTALDWGHLIHFITGIVGYIAGIVAIFTGLSGIRTKKPGYIALILWTFNFIFGISPLGWGLNT